MVIGQCWMYSRAVRTPGLRRGQQNLSHRAIAGIRMVAGHGVRIELQFANDLLLEYIH